MVEDTKGKLEFELAQPDLFGEKPQKIIIKNVGGAIEVQIDKQKIKLSSRAWSKIGQGIRMVQ